MSLAHAVAAVRLAPIRVVDAFVRRAGFIRQARAAREDGVVGREGVPAVAGACVRVAVEQRLWRQIQFEEGARGARRDPHPVRQASGGSKRPASTTNPGHLLCFTASSVPDPVDVSPVPRRWEIRLIHLLFYLID